MWQDLLPLYNDGRFGEVIGQCESALALLPEDPQVSILLASAYHSCGRDAEALPLFLRLQRLFPDNGEITGRLLSVLWRLALAARERGARDMAVAYLEQALALAPAAEDIRRELTNQCVMMSRILESQGHWEPAAHWMERAFRASARDEFRRYALKMQGLGAAVEGDILNAIPLLRNSISGQALSESYDVIRICLQELLPIRDRGFPLSILPLARFERPADLENVYFVAHMLLVRDQPLSVARAFCASLLESLPNSDTLRIALGAASDIAAEPEEARQHYRRILEYCPEHPGALQGIAAVEQLPLPTISYNSVKEYHHPQKTTLNIVIYSNCQGRPISYLLERCLSARYKVKISFIRNYEMAHAYPLQLARKNIECADIFIYQPQRVGGGPVFAIPASLAELIPTDSVKISFPYIYNASLWPMVHDGNCVLSGEQFRKLIATGLDADLLWKLYLDDALDFDFGRRWDDTMAGLVQRELFTDVKLAPFITAEIRRQCLFTGHRHPRHPVYTEGARQILSILSGVGIESPESLLEEVAQQAEYISFSRRLFSCEFFPVDRYAQRHYQFEWVQPGGEETTELYYRLLLRWAAEGALRVEGDRRSDG